VIGRAERFDAPGAALINCLALAAHAYDDTHLATITHPTGPVIAALLALAEQQAIRGEDFLAALTTGMEIECRLSSTIVAPGLGASGGWYITGVTGSIGAAAAVGARAWSRLRQDGQRTRACGSAILRHTRHACQHGLRLCAGDRRAGGLQRRHDGARGLRMWAGGRRGPERGWSR
jgi:2-methylcitrate dehydratase PrpD